MECENVDSGADTEVEVTEQSKKKYESPNLVEHGTLNEITKGSGTKNPDAALGQRA